MKANLRTRLILIAAMLAQSIGLTGCVTATTIEAAKEQVHYKQQPVDKDGKTTPLEVESVEKAKPEYYALVPFAVVADVALLPIYVGVTIAVNLDLMKPPY